MNLPKPISIARRLGGLILFVGLSHMLHAQAPAFVEFTNQELLTLSTGTHCNLSLHFQIKEQYHIQAAVVKEESLIPTQVLMKSLHGCEMGNPIFPKAEAFYMKGVEEPFYVYSNGIEVLVPLQLTTELAIGEYVLEGVLAYQTCDDFKCYFPRELAFEIPLSVQ